MLNNPGEQRVRNESVTSLERACDVLALFVHSESPTLGVTEIAEVLGYSKAVVHRILSTLRSRAFVELDGSNHRYRLGTESLLLGLSYLDRASFLSFAHESLAELAITTNETATVSIRVEWSRVYVDQVTPRRDVKMVVQLGRPFPLNAGASSKALLAFLSSAEQDEYLGLHHLEALTQRTITDPDRLRKELAGIRERGFALSFGERDASAGSVAAPVFGRDGVLLGVISVSGPGERFSAEVDQSSEALVAATERLSQRLGYLVRPLAKQP